MSLESLEFLLDLDAKVDGAVKLLGTLDRSIATMHHLEIETAKAVAALQKVDKAGEHAGEGHKKHKTALWELGHQFEEAKGAAMGFAEGIGLVVAFEAVEKLVDKVKELGVEIIKAGADDERMAKSFKLLLGDEEGEKTLDYIQHLAKHTEFAENRLENLGASLLRVGFAGQGLRYAVAAAADLAALPGGNLEEAAFALEQIKRTGRVEGRMLKPLGYNEEDFLSQLAVRTGKSAAVLKKEMEKGKLDADQSLAAVYDLIRKRSGKALGDPAVDMSKLMSASITHFKEVPEELFKQIAKSPAFERLNQMLRQLTERFDPESELGGKFFKSMDESLTHFVDALAKVDMGKLINDIGRLIEKGPALVDLLVNLTKALVAAGKATAWIYEHTIPGQFLSDYLRPKVDGAKLHATAREALGPPAAGPGAADGIRAQIWGEAIGGSMAKGIKASSPKAIAATGELGDGVHGEMADKLELHSPSRVFERMGRMSGEGYLEGLDNSLAVMPDIQPAGSFAKPASMGAAGGPIQVTVNVTTNVGGAAGGEAGEQIGEKVAAAVEALMPGALQSAFQRMQQEAGS
jgi:tape measure domain-containing protein